MAGIRFLHTADIHIGKPFGNYPAADRLRAARHDILPRIARLATEHGVAHVLIAGDLFENPNPAAELWRQAAAVMAEAPVDWWLLPGNHDNLGQSGGTWDGIDRLGHPNIHILRKAAVVAMADGVSLLPAPLMSRRPHEDPTGWMDDAVTPDGHIRIGLAHGSITGFSEGEMPDDVIAPDRAALARLDYLALGDWHGEMEIGARTAYSGAPERTGFQHAGRGGVSLVEVSDAGATPKVTRLETGAFSWHATTLDLVPGDDPEAAIMAALPDGPRRESLVRIVARGRLPLDAAAVLQDIAAAVAPDFCHFELDDSAVKADIAPADLDAIAPSGALRQAAQDLADQAADEERAERDRAVARAALARLYGATRGTAE